MITKLLWNVIEKIKCLIEITQQRFPLHRLFWPLKCYWVPRDLPIVKYPRADFILGYPVKIPKFNSQSFNSETKGAELSVYKPNKRYLLSQVKNFQNCISWQLENRLKVKTLPLQTWLWSALTRFYLSLLPFLIRI